METPAKNKILAAIEAHPYALVVIIAVMVVIIIVLAFNKVGVGAKAGTKKKRAVDSDEIDSLMDSIHAAQT